MGVGNRTAGVSTAAGDWVGMVVDVGVDVGVVVGVGVGIGECITVGF